MHQSVATMTAQEFIEHSERPKGSKGLIKKKPQVVVMGRPTDYRDTMPDQVNVYLAQCNDRYEQYLKAKTERGDTYGHRLKVDLPTRTGVALYLGTVETTLTVWAKQYPIFNAALKSVDHEQRERLLNNGLSKAYDPTICKLLLAANHGISDKTVIEHQFTIKDMVEQREEVETVAWDKADLHLQGLAEAVPLEPSDVED